MRSGSGIMTDSTPKADPWADPSFGTGGYDASPNQAPSAYANPSQGQYGGDAIGTGQTFGGRALPPGYQMTPMGPMPMGPNTPYNPEKGWLNDPTNPNLNSGDITRINRGGPGFMGNGYYINDPTAFRLAQADPMRRAYQQSYENASGAMDPNAQKEWRGGQQQLAGNLLGTLNGTQPSVAQQQLQNTTQGNVANAYAMAAASPNNAGAARMAANNAGAINQQAAGQGALLRAQEVQNAQGQLGGVLSGARQQDIGAYGQAGQLGLASLGGLGDINKTMMQGRINQESQQQNAFYGTAGHAIGSQMIGGLASGASAAASMLAHGGYVKGGGSSGVVMGDRVCSGCGKMNSDCECWKKAMGGLILGKGMGGTTDSLKSDTVPIMASPGEIVLPRSVAQHEDAPEKAKLFVEAIRAQRMKRAA